MRLFPKSLTFRLIVINGVWTALALLITGLVLTSLFRVNADNNFERVLLAHAFNVMGAIDRDENGKLTGSPNLGDTRFQTQLSGWYWSVALASDPTKPILFSQSITGEPIDVPTTADRPFNEQFQRAYQTSHESGETVQRLEAQLFVGESDQLVQVLVAGNRSDLMATVSRFNQSLSIAFLVFGIGSVLANFVVVRIGLRPLQRARRDLSGVRNGEADQLEGNYPVEIAPLVEEINGLIEANVSVMTRARTQVGNLAHALKTPLAVILNETRSDKEGGGISNPRTVEEQASMMRLQIQTYLDRARIGAQRGALTARTPVQPVLERLLRVMRRLSPDLTFTLSGDATDAVFQGEEQDLEEVLGNLLENASRFAKQRVDLSVDFAGTSRRNRPLLRFSISDDGPGLDPDQRNKALQRGKRLDESKPGSGLGLSIVKDICEEYGGEVQLSESQWGGLQGAVFLPHLIETPSA
ncbi:MAG: ATP-binding protein [Pseudomonadota bacterium]